MAKRDAPGRRTPPSARRYSPEFKRDAVALLRSSGKAVAAVAKELGISDVTLAAWARDQDKGRHSAETEQAEADRKEAAALRKEIKELKEEIEILKRFTAYWVKEGGQ
ncbi:MAG TPA: transposase [Acidimicrobiales bacterium]|nr:transposase [Acidimicrobiales bacterium]